MDWKALLATFAAVFLAELGDKTQLATLGLASGATSRVSVFLGASAALVATSAIAVLGAEALTRVVPVVWLHRVAGVLLLVMGGFVLWRARA